MLQVKWHVLIPLTDDKTSKYTVSKSIQGRAPLYLSQHHLVFAQFGGDFGLHVHKYQPNDFPKVADVQVSLISLLQGSIKSTCETVLIVQV